MPALLAPPLPEGCPWSGFTPPNVDWCEEELCALVTNPANTWSNLAYVAFGLAMVALARRERGAGASELRLFGPASLVVGVFSLVYHASYTFMLQIFDFVGMFVFCFLPITLNAIRLGQIAPSQRWWVFGAGVAGTSALVPIGFYSGFPIQALVFVLIVVIVVQEAVLRRRDAGGLDYRWYAVALALIAVAALFSALDVTRVWCDPSNHWLQGHAVWHVLSAASLFALFRFYRDALD